MVNYFKIFGLNLFLIGPVHLLWPQITMVQFLTIFCVGALSYAVSQKMGWL